MAAKRFYGITIFMVLAIILSSCGIQPATAKSFSKIEVGTPRDEILKKFGEPSGILSGFWGEMYATDDAGQIVVYYDGDGRVVRITAVNAEGSVEVLVE